MLTRFPSYFKIPMFVLEKVPANPSSDAFSICACNELTILCEHFFGNQGKIKKKKKNEFINEWGNFKFELVTMIKYKKIGIDWSLRHQKHIVPINNVWPERVGSAMKRIKNNKQNTLKSENLNALLKTSTIYLKAGSISNDETSKKAYIELKRYIKKSPMIREKEASTHTTI